MTGEHAGKARWARGKAEDLHGQARELEQDRTGDCQAMVRRRGAGSEISCSLPDTRAWAMGSFSQRSCIAKALSAGALLWGLAACAEPPIAHQEKAMREATTADLQREQDRAAAVSDAALPSGSSPMMTWDSYPALQPRAEHTSDQLLKQIEVLAQSLHSQADSDPASVERVLGVALIDGRQAVSGTGAAKLAASRGAPAISVPPTRA